MLRHEHGEPEKQGVVSLLEQDKGTAPQCVRGKKERRRTGERKDEKSEGPMLHTMAPN